MIYRGRYSKIYYAGINYYSRLEEPRYSTYYNDRNDAWYYICDKREHVIYRGVDLTKDMPGIRNIAILCNHLEWYDKDGYLHKEEYPDDL